MYVSKYFKSGRVRDAGEERGGGVFFRARFKLCGGSAMISSAQLSYFIRLTKKVKKKTDYEEEAKSIAYSIQI
jgi:hypothetical protein